MKTTETTRTTVDLKKSIYTKYKLKAVKENMSTKKLIETTLENAVKNAVKPAQKQSDEQK
jgi:hypothetical protein